MNLTATTRLFLLLGDPVTHSLSPVFQNAAFQARGIDAAYLTLRCNADDVPGIMTALARASGGGNVTVPHKAIAAQAVERPSATVLRTGACNTFHTQDGALCGDNTDVTGFREALRGIIPDVHGARIALIGAGGAAAAALCVLIDDGADVLLVNRSRERADALAQRFTSADAAARARLRVGGNVSALRDEAFDVVVNATSLGLRDDDPLPVDLHMLRHAGAAMDIVSRADGETPWVRHARAFGIPAADGLDMLIHQGAAAFRLWTGEEPPLGAMHEAILRRSRPAAG